MSPPRPPSPIPWLQDACENAEPLTPERIEAIRALAGEQPDDIRKAMLDILDALAQATATRQDKEGADPPGERRIRELESLVKGMASEVTRLADAEDECHRALAEITIKLRTIENRQKRLYSDVRKRVE